MKNIASFLLLGLIFWGMICVVSILHHFAFGGGLPL